MTHEERTWIALPPGEGYTGGPRPASETDVAGALPALECPPLDGSWSPRSDARGPDALRAEQAAGRFTEGSLQAELSPWLAGLTPEELQTALPRLHAMAFWSEAGSGAFGEVTLVRSYEDLRDDVRRDLEACDVLERYELPHDDETRFVAPGPLPAGPITAEVGGFVTQRFTHRGESGGWSERVHLVRLDRWRSAEPDARVRRGWRLERNLIWQRQRFGDALS